MSISTTYTTEIIVPKPQIEEHKGNIKGTLCMEIMGLALAKIAKEHQGRVNEGYSDCSGQHHPCVFGLATPALPNGIGIEVNETGRVIFCYDSSGADMMKITRLCDDIARAYATIAVMRIRNRHGYRVEIEEDVSTSSGRRVSTMAIRS